MAFKTFVEAHARTPIPNGSHFTARNYLLSEPAIDRARILRYQAYVGGATDEHVWTSYHNRYLYRHVSIDAASGLPSAIDPVAPSCPDTFRTNTFSEADDTLKLVHVAWTGYYGSDLPELFRKKATGGISAEERKQLDLLMRRHLQVEWQSLRPTWAVFKEDLPSSINFRAPGWANEVRDALGLLHLTPPHTGGPSIEVVAFVYRVRDIPSLRVATPRTQYALTAPTMLDGTLNPAFCPCPAGEKWGRSVYLDACIPPCREVVHPAFAFTSEHVYAVGHVTKPPSLPLSDARAQHLRWLRDYSDDPGFGDATDSDIL